MSLIINDKKVAGLYKAYVIQNATNTASGIIRIATEEEVKAGLDSLTAVTPKQLATKQDVLIAGNGLEILEDGTINNTQTSAEWGNIIGNILDQEDLNAILLTKANEEETAYELVYENSILTLKNRKGDTLSEVSINELPDVDNVTIVINEENKLQSICEKTKSGTFKYTWIGTESEYTDAKDLGIVDEFTECIIIDSEAEKVVPIVQYEAPTKLSQLANDIEFVTNDELQSVKASLENKIDLQTDGAEIVHRVGNETIDGFKNFKQKIVIENGLGKGRIAHKPVDTSLEDGYIEFGDNTLLYGKQNIQGELYDEKHDIFHAGNLVAGNNITITKKDGVYKINGQAGGGSNYELPIASTTTLGGVKVDGDTIKVTQEGIISASGGSNYELPIASTDILGGVKVDGKTIKVTQEGIISSNGSGLEIGDIGFTQMAIDETKGKRRKLNGQLIIQEQYVELTNIIKNSVALNSDLACTESEWQTAVTMSTAGVCYKYVIDNEAGTIRLPKYPDYFIGGVDNIAPVVGNGMTLGLTDGTANFGLMYIAGNPGVTRPNEGAYGQPIGTEGNTNVNRNSMGVTTDSTKSGIEAQIKQEKIVGTYFIQVATGSETEENIINEIELNNPFSLLDYKYSEYELNNLSWLRSEGQYNYKSTHPAVYDLLLKIYNGTETKAGVNVKLTTETFTDYDFVLNTAEETFRLPIKVKIKPLNGNIPVTTSLEINDVFPVASAIKVTTLNGDGVGISGLQITNDGYVIRGDQTLGTNQMPVTFANLVADGNLADTTDLYLYFYVGETVQNANLINAGRIEEKLANYTTHNMVDGQFVSKRQLLSTATALGEYIYDLSDYLPVDSYDYEVQFEANVNQTSGVCNFRLAREGELDTNFAEVLIAQGGWHNGHAILKVGTDRKIYGRRTNEVPTSFALWVLSYRRLGTNQ